MKAAKGSDSGSVSHLRRRPTTVVLDSQGLSLMMTRDRELLARIKSLRSSGSEVVTCATSIVEVAGQRRAVPALEWVLSDVETLPVTLESALSAVKLLVDSGLTGHQCAIDATVAVAALGAPRPVLMFTSDPTDMALLCGDDVELFHV